ncbi:MAG: gamma-glutamylcyclotransferase, partial [Proteobacteria bacterium]|nr:gamma-glutamylcyclotransferase [Pseudomonadota bacterium]
DAPTPHHAMFVYGTLKRGFPNHHYMDGATFIAPATTVEKYPLLVGGNWFTPYLLPEAGTGHRVKGELWQVPEHMMPALDKLESVHLPNGYRRVEIDVLADGQTAATKAWTYFRERRHIAIIHTGFMDDYQDRRYVAADDRDV